MKRKESWKKLTEIIHEIKEIKTKISDWKKQGHSVGFVPTMGALHIGHESLIERARKENNKVIVSIFVNPIQFGPNEDYEKYPRQMDADKNICEKYGVDIIFAPLHQEMYPENTEITTVVPPGSYQDKLCGKSRIGHFNGVATVVSKLFNIVKPDTAYFGQKDAQQLIIIKKMVKDLNIPVEIISCPIIREQDGLACSSRNAYLSQDERIKALSVSKVLNKINEQYLSGVNSSRKLIENSLPLLDSDIKLEYLEILDAETLSNIQTVKDNTLVAIAVKVGNVRLIDNLLIYTASKK